MLILLFVSEKNNMQYQRELKKMSQRQRNSKPYFKLIDFVFYNEKEIRLLVEDERNNLKSPELRNGSGLSDPTARLAIKNLMPLPKVTIKSKELYHPERWLEVIQRTYNWNMRQSKLQYEIVKRRYAEEDYRKTCSEFHISKTTFH